MPWFLYLALKQLFPSGRKFPFFTAISVTGVALGVMILLVVTSVMGGFGHMLRTMVVQTEGEVQVKSNALIGDSAALLEKIRATPTVAGATPYVEGPVLAMAGNRPAYGQLRGLDLETVATVTNLGRFVAAGRLDDLDDDSVILSWGLAKQLGAGLGAEIEIYSPFLIESLKGDEVFLPRRYRVAGLFEIGHQHLDTSLIFGTLRAAQELYGLGKAVHGINVRVTPGTSEYEAVDRLNRGLPIGMSALPWTQKWENFLWALNLEKTLNFFLLLFIVIIAAFSVMSSLLISVVRKTREIGLLGALGGRARDVALCFCAQAFIIGTTGTALGLGLGALVLVLRNQIVHGIAGALNRTAALREIYQFTDLPAHTQMGDVVMIVTMSVVISTLAGLLPAWRAAKLKPVEALRSE